MGRLFRRSETTSAPEREPAPAELDRVRPGSEGNNIVDASDQPAHSGERQAGEVVSIASDEARKEIRQKRETARKFATLEPEAHLPDRFHPEDGDPLPAGLVGASIIRFGAAPKSAGLEGGGLVIDYRPHGQNHVVRVVLSMNELGMWVSYFGVLPGQDSSIQGVAL